MIVISPAKKLSFNSVDYDYTTSSPAFTNKTNKIIKKLKLLEKSEIKSLMKVSDKISELNYKRIQDFSTKNNEEEQNAAVFLFSGDTFVGLNIQSFDKKELDSAQRRLRILSGLYGLLKPLDNIQPYRLEMGTNTNKLITESLYDFWSNVVTDELNKDIKINKSKNLFNLSSQEYFKCINENKIESNVITPHFKLSKNGKIVPSGMMAKKCRGAMAKYIITKNLESIEDLKSFNDFNFKYDHVDSEKKNILFIKKI